MKIILDQNWQVISSEKLDAQGKNISKSEFNSQGWYSTDIPSTVVNTLAQNKIIPNPYIGINMKKLPGFKKNCKLQLANCQKPENSPYICSWWYRKSFRLHTQLKNDEIWLDIHGINYRANVWLNGHIIADSKEIVGTYRHFSKNITSTMNWNVENILAFEIFSPNPDDLAFSFVDWCPTPPDDDMGIWQPIEIITTKRIRCKSFFIDSDLNIQTLDQAKLKIELELENTDDFIHKPFINIKIGEIEIIKQINLASKSITAIILSSDEFPELIISYPRIWWPYHLGLPELYSCTYQIIENEEISDENSIEFGIRKIESYVNEFDSRIFKINGQEIFIQATAWTPDVLLNQNIEQDIIDVQYLKNLNMNAFRIEGKFGSDNLWSQCNKEGIIVLTGWTCCNHWEKWENWKPEDYIVAYESLTSQIKRLRNNPSLCAWFYGSDFPPIPIVETNYLRILKQFHPNLPAISSAADKPTPISGNPGVKMSGPYSYIPPDYWYNLKLPGSASKFNTETCPDVCIPPIESLKKIIPKADFTIGSESWNFHVGTNQFNNTLLVEKSIKKRFGIYENIEEFCEIAQISGYEGWRAMYEAYRRNFPKSTGIVGWMHNSPWPSIFWQLYDNFNNPNGAFFGAKKSCEPLHLQYSYDDNSIWIINRANTNISDPIQGQVQIYNSKLELKKSIELNSFEIDAFTHKKLLNIQYTNEIEGMYVIILKLYSNTNREKIISQNCYLQSTEKSIYGKKHTFYHTPVKQHQDLSLIHSFPKSSVKIKTSFVEQDNCCEIHLEFKCTSEILAFFIRVDILEKESRDIITPIFWTDNCISLTSNDQYIIKGKIINNERKYNKDNLLIQIKGWNLPEIYILSIDQ